MSRYTIGMFVTSKAGHDENQLYVIIGEDAEYVYLADGKYKTLEKPKKKNKKHIQIIREISEELKEKLQSGKVENEDIKRAIKLYKKQV